LVRSIFRPTTVWKWASWRALEQRSRALEKAAIAAGRDPATLPIAVFNAVTAGLTFYECRIVKESGSIDAIAA
jgi:hypothetical protein